MEDIVKNFSRVKRRMPSINTLSLRDVNLHSLHQIAAIECLSLKHLNISTHEPIMQLSFWKEYTIFRLTPAGLRTLNGELVAPNNRTAAENAFLSLKEFCQQVNYATSLIQFYELYPFTNVRHQTLAFFFFFKVL